MVFGQLGGHRLEVRLLVQRHVITRRAVFKPVHRGLEQHEVVGNQVLIPQVNRSQRVSLSGIERLDRMPLVVNEVGLPGGKLLPQLVLRLVEQAVHVGLAPLEPKACHEVRLVVLLVQRRQRDEHSFRIERRHPCPGVGPFLVRSQLGERLGEKRLHLRLRPDLV